MLPKTKIAHGLIIALALIVAAFATYQLRILSAPVKVTHVPVPQAQEPERKLPVVTLSDLRSRSDSFAVPDKASDALLINIFASWCAPCLTEWPQLMKLSRIEGLAMVGIGLPGDRNLEEFLEDNGDPFDRVGLDASGNVLSQYKAAGMPETYLVDSAGVVRFHHSGPLTADDVGKIEAILKSDKAPKPQSKPAKADAKADPKAH